MAEKREKPVVQAAKDLGINDSVLHRWMQQARESSGTGLPALPGHGRPRDESDFQSALVRLRKEVKALRTAV
ncbi:MAG: transposase [Treponema sp.]|nr:transposase [Treponema sp.]